MLDDYTQSPAEIKAGMLQLKQREKSLNRVMFVGVALSLIAGVGILTQHELIYSFFGVSESIQQLHIPVTADAYLTTFGEQRDYLWNFLGWIGWTILKLLSAFFGAFILMSLLKKIRYFQMKFQSLVMRFVTWLIVFLVIWGGLTYVQYADDNDPQAIYAQLVAYDRNIQNSAIAQHLNESNTDGVVADYLLAQTALLNQDTTVAQVYVGRLVQAELNDANFQAYGFLPEQLWSMQHQIYAEARTPLAKVMLPKAHQAAVFSLWAERILVGMMIALLGMTLIFWLMRRTIKNRINRINEIIG